MLVMCTYIRVDMHKPVCVYVYECICDVMCLGFVFLYCLRMLPLYFERKVSVSFSDECGESGDFL